MNTALHGRSLGHISADILKPVEEQVSPSANSSCSSVPLPRVVAWWVSKHHSSCQHMTPGPPMLKVTGIWNRKAGHSVLYNETVYICTALHHRYRALALQMAEDNWESALFIPSLSLPLLFLSCRPPSGLSSLDKVSQHSPGCLGLPSSCLSGMASLCWPGYTGTISTSHYAQL